MNKKSNAISYRVWLYHVGLRHAYQSDPKEQMIGQLDFLLHNPKKNRIKLPSIGENVIEPQSNLFERPNITDFRLSPSKNKQNSSLFLLSIRTFEYISLYSYKVHIF